MRNPDNRFAGYLACAALAVSSQPGFATGSEQLQLVAMEEIQVWGSEQAKEHATGPTSLLTPADMVSINIATTEDVVKYEPSLVIRRRFIGDANGTLGMRGSNMFQTSRSMVFADGVPLHYLLQSRWNGAPRWTLVSASEIAQVEVLYGPFSAEYSGNAMGGVVLIETAIPQERQFHFDGSFFSQSFDDYGFDDTVSGYKTFASYGDRIGDFSLYLSYNHLENESQPQTFYYGSGSSNATPEPVSGAIPGNDETGNAQLFFGDTGMVDTTTDNLKFKAGYEFDQWFALLNIAYENRHSASNAPNSYVHDAQGNFVWSGHVIQDGQAFFIPASCLNVSEMDRQSLSTGLRLRGGLTDRISLEGNVNRFNILEDETRSSAANPGDPAYTPAGEVVDFGNSGWQTAEVKLLLSDAGVDGLDLVAGVRHESYELNLDVYSSDDYAAGSKDAFSSRSGGETGISAVFTQLNWGINDRWDISLGGRYESWESRNGYFSNDDPATAAFELESVPGRSNDKFSPKFSLGYHPSGLWVFRYSLAKAYRFPIVEELFSQYQAFNAISEANPELKPEDGLHHNLMAERALDQGYVRINLFQETIEDV
ncbi:MAG TPA: TonB-dependent receptor, partial [Gammaproteobacteria bacterium]